MTLQAVKALLVRASKTYSLEETLYPMLITTGNERSIYICVTPCAMARGEFCRALGFALTQFQRTQPSTVITLALPHTPAFRAEADLVARNAARALPWLRFMFVQPSSAASQTSSEPKPVADHDLAQTWAAVAAREGLKGFETPQVARALVRVAQEMTALRVPRTERSDTDLVRIISKLAAAKTKTDRKRLKDGLWKTYPALVGERLWAEIVAAGSALVPTAPARVVGPAKSADLPPTTSPLAKQHVHPSMRTSTVPVQPLDQPQRTVELARGNDYEGLEIPPPGSLFSLANRQPKRR